MGRPKKQPAKAAASNNSMPPSTSNKGPVATKAKETASVKDTQDKPATATPEDPKSLTQPEEAEKSATEMETVKKPTEDSAGDKETTPLVATVLEPVKSPLFIMDDSEGESSQRTTDEGKSHNKDGNTKSSAEREPSKEPQAQVEASRGDKGKQITNTVTGGPLTEKCNCDLCIIDRMNVLRQQSAQRAAERGNTDRTYDPRDLTFIPYPPYIHGISDFSCSKPGRDVQALKVKLPSTKESNSNDEISALSGKQQQDSNNQPKKVAATPTPARPLTRSNSSAAQIPKTVQAVLKKASQALSVGKPGDRSSTCPPGTPRSATFRGNRIVSTPSTLGLSTRALNLRAQRFAHRTQASTAKAIPNTPVGASELSGDDTPQPSDTPMPENSSFWVQSSPAPMTLTHLRPTAPRPFPLVHTATSLSSPTQALSGIAVATTTSSGIPSSFTAINTAPRAFPGTPTPVSSENRGINLTSASPRVSKIPLASPSRLVAVMNTTPVPTRAQNTPLVGVALNANTSAQRQGVLATGTNGNFRNANRQNVGRPMGSRPLGELSASGVQNTSTPGDPPTSSPKRARASEQTDTNGSPTKKSRVSAEEKNKENRAPGLTGNTQAVAQRTPGSVVFDLNKENVAPTTIKTRAERLRAQGLSMLNKPDVSPASRVHGMALEAEADEMTSLALRVPPPMYGNGNSGIPVTPVATNDTGGKFRVNLAMEEQKCLTLIKQIDNKMKAHKSGLEHGAFMMDLLQTKLKVVRRAAAGSPGEGMVIEDW